LKKHTFFNFLFLFLLSTFSVAQELDVTVNVSVNQVDIKSDPQIFKALETQVREFFNRTKWTNDDYRDHEKIRATIQINIESEISTSLFQGEIIVKSSRPVYNSNYETPILNHIDKPVSFTFNIGQVIQRSDNVYIDNLSSLLTFYSFMILGYDYDTFSPLGGDVHFQSANDVRNALPNSIKNGPEWTNDMSVSRNKYYMVNDMLDPRVRGFRMFQYKYHREILDNMYLDPDKQRAILASSITDLRSVNEVYPNSMVLYMFGDSKRQELLEIFKVADLNQKRKVYDVMVGINPTLSPVLEPLTR
jgi:Domain of unknown function (DUF4835)